jgi:ATP-dependent Clp protease ATP-binding subunit ClpA
MDTAMTTLHLDPDARAVAMRAYDHAIRLGHRYLGGEHFLLALAEADTPASAVLRAQGLTPERVEAQLTRLAAGGLFGDLDRDALAAAGIDVDAVRARAEALFGPQALSQANQAVRREPAISRWNPRRVRRSGAERDGVFLPHGPGAVQGQLTARQEAAARHAPEVSTGHLALGLIAVPDGLVPPILAALGVSAAALRTALLDGAVPPAPPG